MKKINIKEDIEKMKEEIDDLIEENDKLPLIFNLI